MSFFNSIVSFFRDPPYDPPEHLLKRVARDCSHRMMNVFIDHSDSGQRSLEDRCFVHWEPSVWESGAYLLYFSYWNCVGRSGGWSYTADNELTPHLCRKEFWDALPAYLRSECQQYINSKFSYPGNVQISVSSAKWDSPSVCDEEKYIGITVSFTCRGRY